MLAERAYFLDASRSATGRAWVDRLDANTSRIAQAISQRTDLSEILSRIVAGRGIGPDEAESFLNPTIRDLMPDPSTMTAMDKLVARLAWAIVDVERDGEGVALHADQAQAQQRVEAAHQRGSFSRLAMLLRWIAEDPPRIGITNMSRT